jgi:peroxiredoxin
VAQLRREKAKLDEAGLQVVLVGLGTRAEALDFIRRFGVPFPIIVDPEKHLYRTYGLKRASFMQLVTPEILLKGLKSMREGHLPGRPQGDVQQLPGAFVINQKGYILLSHFAQNAADHLSVDEIIAATLKTAA